jgi:hypothetical protein
MTDAPPDLVADITLYPTERGGRRGPTPPEWFACVCLLAPDDGRGWDCRLLLGGRSLLPGETRRVGMVFLSDGEAVAMLRNADRFLLWDGRVVGEGTVRS